MAGSQGICVGVGGRPTMRYNRGGIDEKKEMELQKEILLGCMLGEDNEKNLNVHMFQFCQYFVNPINLYES